MKLKNLRLPVALKVISLVVIGIIAYTVILFNIISHNIRNEMYAFFEEDIIKNEDMVSEKLNEVQQRLDDSTKLIQETIESVIAEDADIDVIEILANDLCRNAVDVSKVDYMLVFDGDSNLISTDFEGTYFNESELNDALNGKTVNTIVKEFSDLYAVSAYPINGGSDGAVISRRKISTDSFVKEVADFVNLEFTIFDGPNRAYTSIEGMKNEVISDSSVIDDAIKNGRTILETTIYGKKYIGDYYLFKDKVSGELITVLFLGMEISAVDNVANAIFLPLIATAITCSVVLIAAMILIITFFIIKPLRNVGKAINGLSSGDADLTTRIPVKGNDEFADLGKGVNKFIELLQGIIKKLRQAQESLVAIGENLGTNSQQSASATAEIMANIEGVRKQSQNQSDAVGNTSAVLSQSTNAVNNLGDLITEQAAGITESSAAIEEMLGNITSVSNSVQKMSESFAILSKTVDTGNQKIGDVSHKVTQMSEQSNMLLQANEMISQVAAQTNLLAMNAAIEAAHAGEAGKGFSVVADEIRKLAETSSAQSKHINEKLKEISGYIQDVVVLTKDSQVAFQEIVSQLGSTDTIIRQIGNAMTEQDNASHQILESLNDMRNQSIQVNEKSQELNTGVTSVTNDMTTVSQISDTILGSMDEMTAGSQEINAAAQNVSDLAQQTKDNIETMNELLNQFKI